MEEFSAFCDDELKGIEYSINTPKGQIEDCNTSSEHEGVEEICLTWDAASDEFALTPLHLSSSAPKSATLYFPTLELGELLSPYYSSLLRENSMDY